MRTVALALTILTLAFSTASAQVDDPAALAKVIAPLIDDSAVVLIGIDTQRIDLDAFTDRISKLSGLAPESMASFKTTTRDRLARFKQTGATRIYLVLTLAASPVPVFYVIVPLEHKTDPQALSALLLRKRPAPAPDEEWPPAHHQPTEAELVITEETARFDGALVAAPSDTIKRLRAGKTFPRPELAPALTAVDKSAIHLILLPTPDVRRVLEEMVPALYPEQGIQSVLPLSKGLQWAALSVDGSLSSLSFVSEFTDAASAEALLALIVKTHAGLARDPAIRARLPRIVDLAPLLTPTRQGNRLLLTLNEPQLASIADVLLKPLLAADAATASYNQGVQHCNQGELDLAIEDFTKAIALKPDYAVAHNDRGIAYYSKGDYDHAIQDLTRAIELKPDYAEAFNTRGVSYAAKGDFGLAIQDYNRAVELNRNDAKVYCNRSAAYKAKGDFDLAIQDSTKAIELKPDYALAYNNRAFAYRAKGDLDRTVQDFTKAIELKPDDAAAYCNRAVAYQDKDDCVRAASDFTKAIELKPDHVYARVRLFLAKEHLAQDGKSSLADFRKTLKDDDWMTHVVKMYLGEITPDQCLAAASDKDPKRDKEKKCEVYFYVGQFYLLRGDKDRARDLFKQCLATGVTTFTEYTSAQAELKRLDPPQPK